MEAHSGEQSFSSYLKEIKELLIAMRDQSRTWGEFHEKLDQLGIFLKQRGNGLVFADQKKKVFEHASAVDRSFSKQRLEGIFGPFIPVEKDRMGPATDEDRRYRRKPLDPKLEKHPVWKKFKKQKGKTRFKKFMETQAPINAEAREALAIQAAYLNLLTGQSSKKIRQRQARPKKGRSR